MKELAHIMDLSFGVAGGLYSENPQAAIPCLQSENCSIDEITETKIRISKNDFKKTEFELFSFNFSLLAILLPKTSSPHLGIFTRL